ncbi:hypothetical protein L7F22_037586 [Adiantum nelumboides]|nr:hypothetical protein [Adiantum nelumboides]
MENSMKEVSEQPSTADGSNSSAHIMQHGKPFVVAASDESQGTCRSASFQDVLLEHRKDGRSSGDLSTFGSVDKTQVKDSSEFVKHAESGSSSSVSPWTRLRDAHHKSTQQIKGNLRQAGDSHTMNEIRLLENVDMPESRVNEVHEVASADTRGESLALESPKERLSISQFYVPQKGDLVLGAVTFINDQKVDLEIGAELSALMPLRDLQPLLQHDDSLFFEVSSEGTCSVPFGESLLLKGKSALNNSFENGVFVTGTILVAEVIGKTIIDGRAILSCKSAAHKFAWHRIDQPVGKGFASPSVGQLISGAQRQLGAAGVMLDSRGCAGVLLAWTMCGGLTAAAMSCSITEQQLMRLNEAVNVKIMQWNEGGLLGAFEGVRVFIPKTELLQRLESTALLRNYVGRTLSVAVVQNDRETSNIIASEVKAWMCKNLQLGTVHDVTVTKVHTYGMQVEIDNTKIRGFVHKTNFSKEYVSSATNYFVVGDKARVMLIKGRDPTKVSFSLADLEKENGLLLRDKELVFRDAEDMGRRYRERFLEQERMLYAVAVNDTRLDQQGVEIANVAWLHL